ncbi:MAG: YceI family protein, partial [Planctomycetota bacterium]
VGFVLFKNRPANWKLTMNLQLLNHIRFYSLFSCLVLTGLGQPNKALSQDLFQIDNSHSSVIFSISHFNIGYIYGRFNRCTGQAKIDRESPEQCQFNFEIESKSIDTNDVGRDTHLKGVEFFDVDTFPKIEFASTKVEKVKSVYQVTGKLKLHGKEKEIKIPFQLLGVGKGPFGNTRMGMIAKFSIKRSEFGMDSMLEDVGDTVAITFSFEGIRQ